MCMSQMLIRLHLSNLTLTQSLSAADSTVGSVDSVWHVSYIIESSRPTALGPLPVRF